MCLIKLVVFDLDNVIIDGEGIDEIGKLVNVEDQIAAITEQAMQGELDFETSINQRVELLKGASVDDIKKLADEMPLMAGAKETISSLKENGFDVAIISGSFDIIANTIKEKLNVDNIFTNSLVEDNGILTGEVIGPLVSGSKLDVLSDFIETAGYSLDECVAVGDGANDISMIESVKYGIAFNAKPALKETADIIVETRNLTDVLDVIINLDSYNTEEGADVDKEVAVETEVVEETADVVVENQDEQVADATEDVVEDVEEIAEDEASEDADEEESVEENSEDESEDADEEVASDESVEDESEDADEEASEDADEEVASDESVEDESEDADEDKNAKSSKKSKKSKNTLPEPVDFELADTIEGVKAQKDEREELITKITGERDSFNKEAKEQRKIRDALNLELKENLAKAIEFRDQRNEINKKVEESKKQRNKVNEEIRNLEWSSGKRDKVKLENEIKKIDKIIETRVLDIKKENQLVKNANDLRKQLTGIKEDDKVKEQADKLKKESEKFHAKVVALSEQAQEAHENMLSYFRKTDEIRTAADEAHKAFVKAKKAAAAKHEEFKMVLSEVHVINKKLGGNRSRKRKSHKSEGSPAKRNREEKEKAEVIFDKFKNGKKLSTEELLLLQKYDIN